MPRKTKPRRDWKFTPRGKRVDFDNNQYYPPPVVEKLCQVHGIEDRQALLARLVLAAEEYKDWQQNVEQVPTGAETKAALAELKQGAHDLIAKLDNLDDISRRKYGRAYQARTNRSAVKLMRGEELTEKDAAVSLGDPSEITNTVTYRGEYQGEIRGVILDHAIAVRCVELIEGAASDALNTLSPDTGGRPAHQALEYWTYLMGQYWERQLERAFRFDHNLKDGPGPTHRFLEDCLAPLDDGALHQLPSAMRHYRADRPDTNA